ncbi:(2Fe-2S)-binding protein [bacterium]|nr:(2Fe-2S)-binding protein [bacterium]
MIICVCRSLNTRHVRDAISAGARSPAQVHAHHRTTINCGKCASCVCDMIRTEHAGAVRAPVGMVAAE